MKILSKKISVVVLAFGFILTLFAGPAQAVSPSTTVASTNDQLGVESSAGVMNVTDIQVFVSCRGGVFRWSASVHGNANYSYSVYSMVNADSWGEFGWQYNGIVSTGSLGIGSTSTYQGSSGGSSQISVQVSIGGHEESASTNCS